MGTLPTLVRATLDVVFAAVLVSSFGCGSGDAASYPRPSECANPGPFSDQPTAASLPSLLIGTWINCSGSWFGGTGVPEDEVGVTINADRTWQKETASSGSLAALDGADDRGTWSIYGGGCCGEMVELTWGSSGLPTNPLFSADGRTLSVTTSAGGNQAILAKATGTP